jgi:hypothetical protein
VRILHAPRNTANQPGYLVAALRRLGHEAEVWQYGANDFGFPADRTFEIKPDGPGIFWDVFREALDRFDVFHFHLGRSLIPHQRALPGFWDLPVYRALGKRVFFTFHGSDCRIRRIHLEVNPWSYYRFADVPADDDRTEKAIEIIRTYANRMFVVSPDYLPFVPEATVLPRVIDLGNWPDPGSEQQPVPLIVHAPSLRGTKGTQFVLDGIAQLRSAGVPFDFKLIEGVTHDVARAEIMAADIVVDNVVTGDYELVSLEAMASGRVAVANIQPTARDAHPDAPVFSVDPETFVARMGDLIGDIDQRRRLAGAGRAYVASVHDADLVAQQLVGYYEEEGAPAHRSFPGWASLEGARRIEQLERRVSGAEQAAARARAESNSLRRRLGLPTVQDTSVESGLKASLPPAIRHRLGRLRRRIRSAGRRS